MATKLNAEKTYQAAHVKRIKNKLKEIKASLFADRPDKSAEAIDVSSTRCCRACDQGCYAQQVSVEGKSMYSTPKAKLTP